MSGLNRSVATGVAGFALGAMLTTGLVKGQAPATKIDGKFSHVAIVVKDVDKAAKTYGEIFGVTPPPARIVKNIPFPPSYGPGRTMGTKTTMITASGVNLELIQPLDGPSPWRDHLEKYGETVHHLAFAVPEWAPAIKFLESKGGKWVQGVEQYNFGYVDLTPQLGFTIEVMGPKINLPPQ
ncbi:MAG: VOC family protein [Vicinamibacterales bacterium]